MVELGTMLRPKPANDEIYHVLNRGVEKRNIFLNDGDYLRFVHDLFEFNDENAALNLNFYLSRQTNPIEVGLRYIDRQPRKLLVDVLAFCLMPNHFHLMLRQRTDQGITKFMRKLGTGYVNYFNQKYQRVGPLFQGKYKIVHVKEESHFIHLPYYIHFNPLDLVAPEWRERSMKNFNKAVRFLENYRWSSYLDYIGIKNFPSVTQREFLTNFFDGPQKYKQEATKWLKELDLEPIKDLALE